MAIDLEKAWKVIEANPGISVKKLEELLGERVDFHCLVVAMESNGFLLAIDGEYLWPFKRLSRKEYNELWRSLDVHSNRGYGGRKMNRSAVQEG